MRAWRVVLVAVFVLLAALFLFLVSMYLTKSLSCGLVVRRTSDSQPSFHPCGYIMSDDSNTTAILLGRIRKLSQEGDSVYVDLDLGVEETAYLGELNTSNLSLESRSEERVILSVSQGRKVAQTFNALLLSQLRKATSHYVLITVPTLANQQYLSAARSKLQTNQSKVLAYINDCPKQIAARLEHLKAPKKNPAPDKSQTCLFWSADVVILN